MLEANPVNRIRNYIDKADQKSLAFTTFCFYLLYTILFFLVEKLDLPAVWHIHSFFDDRIPFSKYAVLPYCFWHVEIPAVLLYELFHADKKEFVRTAFTIWLSMSSALLIFLLIPSEIHLRPETVYGNDIFAVGTRFIYMVDNSKNVCPSLHVTIAILMNKAWLRCMDTKEKKVFFTVLNTIIILSTLFLKQHSLIDVFFGILYCFLIEKLSDHILRKLGFSF